jgi:tetratricopeptide (TPR) repeat protein
LLTVAQQTLLRQLGVFVGGCTLEVAQHVCNPTGDIEMDVAEGVAALLNQSLLQREEGVGGVLRFVMLETIREYALERLVAGEEAQTLRRHHALHYLALAEEAAPQLYGSQQRLWLARLEAEHDNLRAALTWSQVAGDAVLGLRLAGVLWRFWSIHGYLSEGRDWLAALLALPHHSDASSSLRAQALYGASMLASYQGDDSQAGVLCGESLTLFRELGDKRGMARSLNQLGAVALSQLDPDRATARLQESLSLFRELGDKSGIAESLDHLGRAARDQGDYAAACSRFQASLSLYRELGDTQGAAISLKGLGNIAWFQGDYATARARFEESLSLLRELGDTSGTALVLNHLALVAREQGDYAAARSRYEASLALWQEVGNQGRIAYSLFGVGDMAYRQGDYATARAFYKNSLARWQELGDIWGTALVISKFASLLTAQGQPVRAARLWGAAEALNAASGPWLPPPEQAEHDRCVAATRAQIDEEVFAAAWAEGRSMSLDQVIAYADAQEE